MFNSESIGIQKVDSTFMSSVWSFFGLAILIATIGAWSGEFLLSTFGALGFYGPYILFMGIMFTQTMWLNSSVKLPMFALFAFSSGAILYPTLAFAGATGQIGVVVQALLAASLTFFAAGLFGYTTKKDLSGWGNYLFMAMIGLFVLGMMGMLGSVFNIEILKFSDTMHMFYSGASILLFTAFTCYDIQAIKNGAYPSPVMAAFHLYFSFFVIVQNMLQIFLNRD
jgi:FtsH-binding integral membrane protein